ncbi:MAG: energy transducer TonB [candidate division Zixibacteria bacterium]|jgi:protein TonB|nr:energy transducer TonB [candidate division Zixibacteria bacterium]
MANHTYNALYSPYGAYELKAKYQRNFGLGTLATLAFVLAILGTAWLIANIGKDEEVIFAAPTVIKTVADLGPPPAIAKKPPQIQVSQPNVAAPRVGIPTPVADEEVIDEDVVLATREEMAEIIAPDVISGAVGDGDIVVDIQEEDYLPAPSEFVPVEIIPDMIYQEKPEYPRLAKQAGIEGRVWVKVLVDKNGNARDALVAKSSGTASLDEAAVAAAKKCRFKPGIQNGQPVACWVTFDYDFKLTGG